MWAMEIKLDDREADQRNRSDAQAQTLFVILL